MIQYYRDLEEQVRYLAESDLSGGQIQKIYSTAYYISFSIRSPGKTQHLFLGRGGGMEGVWLHDSPPPSPLRRKDNFLEYLRRYLSSCTFLSGEVDASDRIFKINYQKYGCTQSILFFWKARKLYFLHYFKESAEAPYKLLLSWRGKSILAGDDLSNLYDYFDEVGRKTDMKQDFKNPHIVGIAELLNVELKAAALKSHTSNPGFLHRKKENIEEDLRKNQQWDKLQSILDQGQSLDAMYELKVGDHKIKFEGELNPYERRNILFQKIKKLKRGEGILTERLRGIVEQLAGKEIKTQTTSLLPITKPIWGKDEPLIQAAEQKASLEAGTEFKLFQFPSFLIGVGLSAKGNDHLRSKWANKDDTWIHLDGLKSAHAVVKTLNNQAVSPAALNLGATIVAQFSHFSGDWIPIIYTQVKNLKGVSGAPGMVTYKKEKHLRCPLVKIDEFKEEQ